MRGVPRHVLPLLACLLATACAPSTRAPPKLAPDSTILGACQREAEDDPKVKELLLQNFYTAALPPHDEALRSARRDATNACLKAHGQPVPGGVEPVRKSGYLF